MDPEAYLNSLEPIGWKLGLDRMHRLSTALGMPQHRFASIHVVGTNGKSSVTRMIAALLEAHGLSAGACVSPHSSRWSERTLIHGEEIGPAEFAAAVERARQGAETVNRGLEGGEEVTQFEVATAASFVALAAARVEVVVAEAGLGGRLDATNTIPSRVTVLTSVGLDHTEWLGETELEIAAEKLAVLRDQSTLVIGGVSKQVGELAERVVGERGARLIRAPEDPGAELRMRAPGGFQRRNFALAMAAATAFHGDLDPDRVAAVAEALTIPGRLEQIAAGPPTIIDAAHNPDGARALAAALAEIDPPRPVAACIAILGDKDAEGMLAALAPAIDAAICTEIPPAELATHGRPGAASHAARELAALCRAAGVETEAVPDLARALARTREIAEEGGGTALIVGSHYLLAPARAALGTEHRG